MITARKSAAFTLVEAMVATAILAGVMGVTLALMSSMAQATGAEKRHAVLLQENARAMEAMSSRLQMSRIVEGGLIDGGAGNLGSSAIAWQIPVRDTATGMVVNSAMAVQWGVVRQGLPQVGEFGAFRFVPTGTFDETAEDVDLNGDGQRNLVFDVGFIEEAVFDNEDLTGDPLLRRRLTPDNVVQIPGDPLGDITGDGLFDPLFTLINGSTMRIRIFYFDPDRPARFFRRSEILVPLFNHM